MSVAFKELMECFDAADAAVADIKAVLADGKVDWQDISILFKLSGQLSVFNTAVQGIGNITLAALSAMSADEVAQVVARVQALLANVGLMALEKQKVQ